MQLIYKAPCAKLERLENLWLQLSNVACNIKCRHCYLDCHNDVRKKNFLKYDIVLNLLNNLSQDVKRIYLTGGEPFLYPKIIELLSVCLPKADVLIFTNGTLLSEKKIKLIKAIEEQSKHKLFIRLSLDHFTEGRNDEYRARGVFKKVINALVLLQRYEIKTDISCVNIKNDNEEILIDGFLKLFEKNKLNLTKDDIRILPLLKMGNYAKFYTISDVPKLVTFDELKDFDMELLDCKNSRVVTVNGVYSCPALINDPRGKVGDNLDDFANNVYLETQTCFDCVSRSNKMFC